MTNLRVGALGASFDLRNNAISTHDATLDSITRAAAPTLREAFGIGPDASAEMMIVAGDNPSRIRSEAAFAKLCGACPIPASSGVTNRHRLFRGGHRQANATLYRIVIVRMRWHQPTMTYVTRRIEPPRVCERARYLTPAVMTRASCAR